MGTIAGTRVLCTQYPARVTMEAVCLFGVCERRLVIFEEESCYLSCWELVHGSMWLHLRSYFLLLEKYLLHLFDEFPVGGR